jgi:mutator protein MutT
MKTKLRQSSLVFLIKDNKILLAMKKRGFGKGRWNGVGGKIQKGETIKQAAIRETKEEIDVNVKTLKKVGTLDFYFDLNKEWDQSVIVFLVNNWEGSPKETEEMRPKWFNFDNLPFKKMWEDDAYWLPQILAGKRVKAEFSFGENDKLLDQKVKML